MYKLNIKTSRSVIIDSDKVSSCLCSKHTVIFKYINTFQATGCFGQENMVKTSTKEIYIKLEGTTVAQWLRFCATNRKVTGLIPDGVIGFFH
jgi:hypothetical protein